MIYHLRPSVVLLPLLLTMGCGAPRDGVEEKFNFFPLARYEVSERPDGYTVDALWPLINAWRAGDATGSRAVPLYFHDDDGEGERFTNVLALYWQTLEDGSVQRDLFPFWHYVRSDDESDTRLWPLYGLHEYGGPDRPYRSDLALWPLYSFDRKLDGSWNELGLVAAWPLFALFHRSTWSRSEPLGTDETGRTDLSRKTGGTGTQVGAVFGDTITLANHRSDLLVPTEASPDQPVATRTSVNLVEIDGLFKLWGSESTTNGGPTRHELLNFFDEPRLSLFSWEDDPDVGAFHRHLFPLWFQHQGEDDKGFFLLPLFGTSRDGTLERTWILPPLLGLESDPAREFSAVDVLYPLIRSSTEGSGEDAETHFRALPLAWFTLREDSALRLVLPLYYDIEDAHSRYQHFIPFYGQNVEDAGATRTTFILAPLFVRTEEDAVARTDTHVLFPLIEFEEHEGGRMSRFFPFCYSREGDGGDHLNLLGLFDHVEDGSFKRSLLYPLFATSMEGQDGTSTSILPLLDLRILDDGRPDKDEVSVLFPLSSFREGDEGGVSRWIFPLYWQFEDPSAGKSTRHLWPLLGRSQRDTKITWSTLWPLFFTSSDATDDSFSELGYLFPLGFSCQDQDNVQNWLFPLWYHHREDEESTSWFLWPLFHREADARSSTWHSLFYLLRDEVTETSEEFSVLYALYRGRTEGEKTTRSVPFLFHYENDAGARELRLFHLIPIRW